uniref:Uncharacterized protein n=1 Tax=Siphoviridae sp. ct5op20 TaxID=2826295 RepID=A0A8S5NPZ7_9CAUD|nr:MAG TPA: hypothetical protein [Siphoviridae sp. ct5op20]
MLKHFLLFVKLVHYNYSHQNIDSNNTFNFRTFKRS